MNIRRATEADLKFIDDLRRKESEAVGFIPLERYRMEMDGRRNGRLWVAEENADLVGFAYCTYGDVGHIQQIAIRSDARLEERASALVIAHDMESVRRGLSESGCRVADDLEATRFWEALGFRGVRSVDGGLARARRITYYRKALTPRLLEVAS